MFAVPLNASTQNSVAENNFDKLPFEVIKEIFNHAVDDNDVNTIGNLSKTCKRFKEIISKTNADKIIHFLAKKNKLDKELKTSIVNSLNPDSIMWLENLNDINSVVRQIGVASLYEKNELLLLKRSGELGNIDARLKYANSLAYHLKDYKACVKYLHEIDYELFQDNQGDIVSIAYLAAALDKHNYFEEAKTLMFRLKDAGRLKPDKHDTLTIKHHQLEFWKKVFGDE